MLTCAYEDPAGAIPVTVTRFPAVNAPAQWTDEVTTWGAFVESIEREGVAPYTAKDRAPLHALYRLRRGGRRCNEDVEFVYGVCLDFDHVPPEHVISCVEALQADGIACLWHTTWSHGEPLDPANPKHAKARSMLGPGATTDERRRVIVPLAEPVPGAQYDALLGLLWGRYAEHADREAGGAHRAFYVPSRAPDREGELFYLSGAGFRFVPLTPPTTTMLTCAQEDPASAIPVTVTRFPAVNAPAQWTDEVTTWGAFVESIEREGVAPYTAKDRAPLHALYRLRRGGRRCNEDVELVYGVCLDFDHVPPERVISCVEALQADGIACLWHTTWSHGEPLDPGNPRHAKARAMLGPGATTDERRRVIVPLAEPVPGAQYDALLGLLWGRYAEHADREAGGAHRAFYVPSRAPDREGELFYLSGAGFRFVPLTPPPGTRSGAAVISISDAVWTKLAAKWARSGKSKEQDYADRMRRILDGVPYAEHGERDIITWRLAQAIIYAYPDVSAESVRSLFRLSIDAMRAAGSSLTEEELVEKLERARREQIAASDTLLPDERKLSIRQAFGSERTHPYTADEITEIQAKVGLSREELDHSWILQYGAGYWLIGPGGSLCYSTRDALENTARVVLAPAPIELHEIGAQGRQWMGRRTLLERYSLPLESVSRSLVIDEPVFELAERRLTMPSCPKREIVPKFDAEIDRWLRLLGGQHYDRLCAWLQWVPDLTRPIAALVLTGDPSIGKGLLAQGVSRIWTTNGPTKLAHAMSQYDQVIESCPYCLSDEHLPKDNRGHERTEDLREFIQCTRRAVDQKYRDRLSLEGAARVQIAANNLNVLTLGGSLSREDVDAIAVRFLHVPGQIEAAAFLAARGGRDGAVPWVEGDGIAAHVLYLAQIKRYEWIGRFGVPTQPDLVDRMLVRGGVRAALCELFVRALRDKQPLRDGACVAGGMFACRVDWIPEAWDLHLGTRRPRPETPGLIQALDGLGQRFEADGEGWFAIETSRLVVWARESGTGNAERVHEWILQHDRTSDV